MKVKFLGMPGNEKDIVLRQLRFPVDTVCVVRDAGLAAKISNLPYFEVIEDEKVKAEDPKAAPGEPETDEGATEAEDAPVEDAEVE